jgi:hypothetical protein
MVFVLVPNVLLLTAVHRGTTVTLQEAVLFPSTVVTVIVAVPLALAVTVPPFTVATVVLLDDQFTF